MKNLKINIKRFGVSVEDEPVYSYAKNAEMKINADFKIEGTNRKLKDLDSDLSNVIALDTTRITIPVKLWENSKPNSSFGKQTINVPNLNQYDYIEIFFKNWVESHYGFISTKCPVANGNVFALCYTICLYRQEPEYRAYKEIGCSYCGLLPIKKSCIVKFACALDIEVYNDNEGFIDPNEEEKFKIFIKEFKL